MDNINVLVCDDSALMRNLISRIIDNTTGMQVCAKAMNGQMALDRIAEFSPDVMILDIEMPVMNGIEFLKERKNRNIDVPVIILSSVATEGAKVTMECLELGASDFLTKPNGSVTADISSVADRLVELLSSYGYPSAMMKGRHVYEPEFFMRQIKMRQAERFVAEQKKQSLERLSIKDKITEANAENVADTVVPPKQFDWIPQEKKQPAVINAVRNPDSIQVIAIGISTGGPNALREVFKQIDPMLKQPVLVVQHMPPGFTAEFARSLDNICPLPVKEAEDEDKIEGGHVYIAPGDFHITIEHRATGNVIRLNRDEVRNGHRPSVDVLFESVADVYKNHALGVIMTGMGKDGAQQLALMRQQGAWTIGQDEKTSIVYGMPRVAYELGAVQKQVALEKMADEISMLAKAHQ